MRDRIIEASIVPTHDFTLPTFDNTKLQAINTCPVWGITRYALHKTMAFEPRRTALEAGTAAHDVYAAERLFRFRFLNDYPDDKAESLFDYHGKRIFGVDRFASMRTSCDNKEDRNTQRIMFALAALETSGYHEDPEDRRRTMENLQNSCLAYLHWIDTSRNRVWVQDIDNPTSPIGIEMPIDTQVSITVDTGEVVEFRFTGKIDGLHVHNDGLYVHENKTASRLDDAWEQSFLMSSQPTGYMIGVSTLYNVHVRQALILGMNVVQPSARAKDAGLKQVYIDREEHQITRWFEWALHTVRLHNAFVDSPADAPQYTHSCNRYFKPCSMISFCSSTKEEQLAALQVMPTEEWSPLHD